MPSIIANTNTSSYEIIISNNSLKMTGKTALSVIKGKKIFIVTDKNVEKLYLETVMDSLAAEGFEVDFYSIVPGEESKTQEELFKIYHRLNDFQISRADGVLALGGGVVGDLAGFAAATYLRGVPLIGVPTTLLAQVDSSVGGKTAIDMPFGKNMVGSFYQPVAVIIDPKVIATLPRSVMNDGMAEVIKYGCIRDADLFESIESGISDLEWVIERCIQIKVSVVAGDERDKGERMLLNFGHTTGHAVEKVYGYKGITHGQAVGIGMVVAAALGEKVGITKSKTCDRITKCLGKYGLPVKTDACFEKIIKAIDSDKKNFSEKLYFVLLKSIGEGILYPFKRDELYEILREVF